MRLQREHSAAVTRQKESQRARLQAEVRALSGELDESQGAEARIQCHALEAEATAEANKHRLQMLTTVLRLRDLQLGELTLLGQARRKTCRQSLAMREPEEEVDGGSTDATSSAAPPAAAASSAECSSASSRVRRSLFQEHGPEEQQQQVELLPGLEREVALLRQQVDALEQALAEPKEVSGLQDPVKVFTAKSEKQPSRRSATSGTCDRVQRFCALLAREEECMASLAQSGKECSRRLAEMLADLQPLMPSPETEGTVVPQPQEQEERPVGVEHLLRLAEEAFGEPNHELADASFEDLLGDTGVRNSVVAQLPGRGLATKKASLLPQMLAEALQEVRGLERGSTNSWSPHMSVVRTPHALPAGAAAAGAAAAAAGACDTPSTAAAQSPQSEGAEAEVVGAARQAAWAPPSFGEPSPQERREAHAAAATADSPGSGFTSNSSPESAGSCDSTRYRPQPGDSVDELLAEFLNQRRNRLRRSLFTRVDHGLYRYGTRSTHLRLGATRDELEAAEVGTDRWEPLEDFARRLEREQSDRLRRARQRAKALSIP